MTRISVVIPTNNRARLLVRALRSVLDQTRAADEIIVIDDGSTDATTELVSGMPVRLIRQDNAGASIARNRGVREASSPWVAFLDSDDLWDPGHLEVIANAIDATAGGAVLYFTDAERAAGGVWATRGFASPEALRLVPDGRTWVIRDAQPMVVPGCVVASDAFHAVGGFDARLPSREDTHLFLRLGIGRPLCAVAGGPAIITDDDTTGSRLTAAHGNRTRSWWESTVRLYADVLTLPDLARAEQTSLRSALSEGHWRLGRHLLQGGDIGPGVAHAVRAFRLETWAFLKRRSTSFAFRRRGASL